MFSPHFSIPLLKFIGQMLFGIQAAKSVLLTRIGHEHVMDVESVARICHTPYEAWVEFNAYGEDEPTKISFGVIDVSLPEDKERPEASGAALRLVVVKGFGKTPMMLLTTLAVVDTRDAVWESIQAHDGTKTTERTPRGADFPALGGLSRAQRPCAAGMVFVCRKRSTVQVFCHNCKNAVGWCKIKYEFI